MLIAYFVAVSSGPEAYPRFRAPIVPLLAMLAGVGCPEPPIGAGTPAARLIGLVASRLQAGMARSGHAR